MLSSSRTWACLLVLSTGAAQACTPPGSSGADGAIGDAADQPADPLDPESPDGAAPGSASSADGGAADAGDAGTPPVVPACTASGSLCTPAGCSLAIARPAPVTVTGSVHRDGYSPAGGNAPTIRFVDTTTGEAAFASVFGVTYAASVVPGTYDVYFDYVGFPSYRAASGLSVTAATTLDIDANTANFALLLSRAGAAMSPSDYPAITFLTYTGTRDRQRTDTQFAKAYVGSYDVFVADDPEDSPGLPVTSSVVLTNGKHLGTMPITFAETTGVVTLDGVPASGRLRFFDKVNDRRFLAGTSAQGAYRVRLTPGTYDVSFDPSSPNVATGAFDVATGVSLTTDGVRAFSLATHPVTVAATLDGEPLAGTVVLRDGAGVDHTAPLASGAAVTRVGAGTYDAFVERHDWTAELRARVQAGVVVGAPVALSAPLTRVKTTPSIAGVNGLYLSLLRPATGEYYVTAFGAPADVMGGAWDSYVTMDAPGASRAIARAPWDVYMLLGVRGPQVTVIPGGTTDVTPVLRDVTGQFTMGGVPSAAASFSVELVDRDSGRSYRAMPAVNGGGGFAFRAGPGLYDIFVSTSTVGPRVKVADCAKID